MSRFLILSFAALAVIALIIAAADLWLNPSTNVAEAPLVADEVSPEVSADEGTDADNERSFIMHEAPREVPPLTFIDGEGRSMTLDAFDGQIVVLNIWATWCVPCREEMPALDRLQERLGGRDLQVVALSIDKGGLEPVKAFYDELELENLAVYVDPSAQVSRDLAVVGIPTTLLIGPSGRELGRLVGPAVWDSEEMVRFLGQFLILTTGGECDCPMGMKGGAMPGT